MQIHRHLVRACCLLSLLMASPLPAQEEGAQTIRYPIGQAVPMQSEDLLRTAPVDLRQPENIQTVTEYDAKDGKYYIRTYVGERELGTPIVMTQAEYLAYQEDRSAAAFWKAKNKIDYSKSADDFSLTDMQFDLGFGDKIFGEGGVRLRTQGSVEVKFGVKTNKVDNPALSERARNRTYFDFDQEIQMSVNGRVGDKINVNMNYDTEATFDYDAKSMKLRYDGKEDEIIRTLEAGNVSMPLNSSLITGGTSLFGIKTELQFGKLSVAGVVSQQQSQMRSVQLDGGVQTRSYEVAVDAYDENRHFFLSHYFRDHYDEWMKKIPYIASGIQITKVEVWVTNKSAVLDNARNIVAFADMAEPSVISNSHWSASGAGLPANESNSVYPTLIQNHSDARQFAQVSPSFEPLTQAGVRIGQDYERLESARRLESSEYSLNTSLGYISLKQALNSDEILAVAYTYTRGGKSYQVGEFSTDGIESPKTLFVKLLKGTYQSPEAPGWDLMMKNIYVLGDAYNLTSEDFTLNIVYRNDSIGTDLTYLTEGRIRNELLLRVMGLDRLNSKKEAYPDGLFDYVEGLTVQSANGRIVFPVLEPFGAHLRSQLNDPTLAERYCFDALYDSTLTVAQQLTEQNKFKLTGSYKAASGASISLGAMNVAPGSVTVTAGGQVLTENVDYTVDYISGTVTITNTDLVRSGTAISATCEDQATFSMIRKTMTGLHLEYKFNEDFSLGGTLMRLSERPLTTKVDMGYESVNNTIFGFNTSYRSDFQWLTNVVDKLPFLEATQPSSLKLNAEYAQLIAGTSKDVGNTSYVDDFEAAKKTYSLKDVNLWFLASTPHDPNGGLFPEAAYSNDFRYGYNRSHLAWYIIDGLFNHRNGSQTPSHIRNDMEQLSNHYVRAVNEKEIFPNRDIAYNQTGTLPVLNLVFYPEERGAYNYNVDDLMPNGRLRDPQTRWGGIMRRIESGYTNFEANNVEYVEFWLMDPFVYDTASVQTGGDLYINLGELSEDVLKDGKRSFENGLPVTQADENLISTTAWGKVSSKTSTAYAFDNTAGVRIKQDVGLDGLSDSDEHQWPGITEYVQAVRSKVDLQTLQEMEADPFSPLNDPAGDNYHYYRGSDFDDDKTSILDRYKRYNGMEGNSLSQEYTNESYSTAATTLPNVEDINLDFTLNETERYYQYRISLRPEDMQVGQNYINDVRKASVQLKNGKTEEVTWYQFKVPVSDYNEKIGSINGFNSIRFMRMFLTDFEEQVVLRFATLDLVRGDWRRYTKPLYLDGTVPSTDATLDVSTISLEENSGRQPINYRMPPGVQQETDPSQPGVFMEDEQSMIMKITDLAHGDARAVYRNTSYDFRQYERLQLFVHAEAFLDALEPVKDYELTAFIRLGSDFQSNYYEYEIPLEISPFYNHAATSIWPENNYFDIPFELLTRLKNTRNSTGQSYHQIFSEYDPENAQNRVSMRGNPSLSDVRTIMIGIRNRSGRVRSVEVWLNEMRLNGFREEGGWAGVGSAVLNLSDVGNITASGKYLSSGFGSLEQSVSQRRQDDYSQYNIALNFELGRFFSEKLDFHFPLYYSISNERILPKYDPLNQDLMLKDVLDAAATDAIRDSILNYSLTLKKYRSLNFSNVRLNVRSKTPMPYDPSNFTFNYNETRSVAQDPTTDHEVTKNYNGGVSYSYASPLKTWQPFSQAVKNPSPWLKALKEFNLNPLPNTLSASSNLTRYYYEMQSRDLSSSTDGYTSPLTVQKNFLWNTDLNLQWNITKNIRSSFSINNQAEVLETRYSPVNKTLYATEYEHWKDTVSQSLREFGSPLDYRHDVNLTWNVPLNYLPILDFMTLNAQYHAFYNWQRSTSSGSDTEMGNQISNQRSLSVNQNANLLNLYQKSELLKGFLRPTSPTPTAKEAKRYQEELLLYGDTTLMIAHQLNNKRIQVNVVDTLTGRKQPVRFTIVDENQLRLQANLADSSVLRVVILQKKPLEEQPWYAAVRLIGRTLMSLRSFNVTYKETDGLTIPGFKPESGLWSANDYGRAPGWDFALGVQSSDYLEKAVGRDWLIRSDSIVSPAYQSKQKDLRIKAGFELLPSLKIDLNALRTWNFNTEIQYMFDGMPEMRTGSFTISTVAIRSSFESPKASNGYYSASFERFLENRAVIASRLEAKLIGTNYPSTGFMKGHALAGEPFDPANGTFAANSADVLIPAFLAAYTGGDARNSSLELFPGLLSMLPNWSVSYDGLSKLEFVQKYFRNLTLNHGYTSTYSVSSFSSFSNFAEGESGLGYVRNVLSNAPTPSSMYDVAGVSLTESFNPLFRVQGTLKNGFTLRTEMRKTRNLNLSISGGQIVEADQDQWTVGTSYKLSNFHPWGFMSESKIPNDLSLTGNLSYRNQHNLLRKIDEAYTQASSGNRSFALELMGDYVISRNMNLTFFYDLESTVPLVSSYPITTSNFGFSVRFSLNR
ncbi:MAG: cell surface protein SprA [Bacteroidales bacterium]|nr:cell surface protein SprA [Bacteroidales bacterium]